MAVAPVTLAGFVLPHDVRKVFRRENRVGRTALQLSALVPSQANQGVVREDHTELVINDDHALVERFEDALHLANQSGVSMIAASSGFFFRGSFPSMGAVTCEQRERSIESQAIKLNSMGSRVTVGVGNAIANVRVHLAKSLDQKR